VNSYILPCFAEVGSIVGEVMLMVVAVFEKRNKPLFYTNFTMVTTKVEQILR